jgi:hypothetical protein
LELVHKTRQAYRAGLEQICQGLGLGAHLFVVIFIVIAADSTGLFPSPIRLVGLRIHGHWTSRW